jgi:hypothetical protein
MNINALPDHARPLSADNHRTSVQILALDVGPILSVAEVGSDSKTGIVENWAK